MSEIFRAYEGGVMHIFGSANGDRLLGSGIAIGTVFHEPGGTYTCNNHGGGTDEADWTQIERGGARLVVQSIPGTLKTYILDPDDGDAANADAERINDVTGFKAFRVTPITPGAATGLLAVIFGWSTSAGDLTAVNTAMSAVDADVTTPGSAGQANTGAYALFPVNATAASNTQLGFTESPWIIAESDTIKTIAVRSSGVDYPKGVRVEVIV